MRLSILTTACALCFALPTTAQEAAVKTKDATAAKFQVFGGTSSRPNTGVFLFSETFAAGITISHGQPEWNPDYTNLDSFKGQLLRLGKDQWTTLMTSVAVDIGGTTVPAGSYVCGLNCDKSGKFGLALIDSTKAMKAGLMPFTMPQTWTPDITVPLTLNKDVSKEVVSKLSIELKGNKQEPTKATFTLAWGPHTLTSPVTFNVTK